MESDNMNLNIMQTEGSEVTNKPLSPDMEKCYVNNNECQIKNSINCSRTDFYLDLLSEVYVEISVVLAAVAVFTETLHGHVPIFHLHVYIYFYLLGIGIIIIFSSFVIQFVYKFCQMNNDLQNDSESWWEYNRYFNIVKYFKFGFAVCGLTALLCSCLECVTAIMSPSTCSNASYKTFSVMHSIFIMGQLLFFLINFKSSRIFTPHKFVVMHLIATNAALWFHAVLFASSNDWQEAVHVKHNSSWGQNEINITVHSLEFDVASKNHSINLPKHAVHVTSNCWWRVPDTEASDDILSFNLCLRNSTVGILWSKVSQIVYPISMQFYLIACFTIYASWKSINIHPRTLSPNLLPNKFECKWSKYFFSKGFVFGILVFITTSIFTILNKIKQMDFITITSMSCVLFGISICANVLGLMQIKYSIISVNQNFVDICLKYGLFPVYVFSSFNVFVGFLIRDVYSLFLSLQSFLIIAHAVIQYIFIKQILSLTLHYLSKIRSKQVVIFLVLCNVSIWIAECFLLWSDVITDMQFNVYGSITWPVVMRILLPCLGFYRLYSAVVLMEAWRSLNIALFDNRFF